MNNHMLKSMTVALLALSTAILPAVAASTPAEATPDTSELRHAVVCPPFKGDAELGSIYRAELVDMLQSSDAVEYLEGSKAASRNAPDFTYRLLGEIIRNENGATFVSIQLLDTARQEVMASLVSPVQTNRANISSWRRTIENDMSRRVSHVPFECRVKRKLGRESLTLDRGLGSGLQPRMVLNIVQEEEPLISPETGEVIGRDTPRAVGQVQVYRVQEDSAYARPLPGSRFPRNAKLYAREF